MAALDYAPESKAALTLDDENDEMADDEWEAQAGHAPRKCTDVLCLLVFFGALTGLGFVLDYCKQNGDMRRLYHGYNYLGQLCGVDTGSDGEVLGEYLYWCSSPDFPEILDLKHPICVSKCPTGPETTTSCVQMPAKVSPAVSVLPPYGAGSFSQTYTYAFAPVEDYASKIWGNKYCMPTDNKLVGQITTQINSNFASKATSQIGQIAGAWVPLLISALMACALGAAFLFIINQFACAIVVLCLAILILVPLVGGSYFVHVGFNGGFDDMPNTGDAEWDKIVGFTLLAISLIFLLLTACCQQAIRTAVAVIKVACHCMFALPSLLLEPVLTVTMKSVVLGGMLVGFAWLMSCGKVQTASLQEFAMSELPGSDLAGVFRSFSYEENEYWYIAYYLFMIFWVMELFTALGQFVCCYTVQLWYFTPYGDSGTKEDVPCCPILGGYFNGFIFHLGSLAFGSFVIACFRIVRIGMRVLEKQLGGGNPAVACIAKCIQCCLACFQKFIEFLNKNAYMDIAITSSNFCSAAKRAFEVIMKNVDTIAILNGACWIIQWAGLGSITAACCFLTWEMLWHIDIFHNSESAHYVQDPVMVTIVSGIISAYVAMAFMHVFDTVADCILYCYAIEKMRRAKGQYEGQQYAPDTLNDLVKSEGRQDM